MSILSLRKREILIIFINAFIAISTLIIAVSGIMFGAVSAQPGDNIIGLGYFKPFTMDSGVLSGIAAAILTIVSVRNLIRNEEATPNWVLIFYFIASVCLALTLSISAFFLAPIQILSGSSYFTMFQKELFFFHLLNPLLSIFTFTCLLNKRRFTKADCFIGAIPMFLYSIVYFMMVVVWKKWSDFYFFTFNGQYKLIPLTVLTIYALTLLLAGILIHFHNKICKE